MNNNAKPRNHVYTKLIFSIFFLSPSWRLGPKTLALAISQEQQTNNHKHLWSMPMLNTFSSQKQRNWWEYKYINWRWRTGPAALPCLLSQIPLSYLHLICNIQIMINKCESATSAKYLAVFGGKFKLHINQFDRGKEWVLYSYEVL